MATGLDILVTAVDRASAVLKDIGTAGKKAGDEVEDGADDASSALDRLKEKAGGIGTILAGIGGTAIGASLLQSFDDSAVSAGKLQAQLGLTKDEAKEFGDIARDVYGNNFAEDLGSATQAVAGIHQALGLTGSELQDTTEDIFRISDAFGHLGAEPEIITENVRAMRAAFPDKSEAEILDLITHGFQSGAGASGDLQDTLQEYPRAFSTIGLSGQDMMNFLESGLEAGARNSDVLGDAVKEMGIIIKEEGSAGQVALSEMFGDKQAAELIKNFGEGGEAGREAFFKILEGLNEIDDPLERNKRAVELFGTKGEDLAGVLDDMLPAFLATKDASIDLEGATKSLDSQYAGIGNRIDGFKRKMETGVVGTLGDVAGPAVSAGIALSGVGTAMAGLSGVGGTIAGVIGKIPAAIGGMIPKIVAWTVATWASVSAHLAAAVAWAAAYLPIIAIIAAVIAVAAALYLAWRTNFLGIQDITASVWGAIKAAISAVIDWLRRRSKRC